MFDFLIRHYKPEKDLLLLSQMLTEIEAMDRDGEDTSQDYLRSALTWHNYRPEQDVWVAELEGKLVGYAVALEQPSRHCTIYGVVHPACRRMGLGSQLIARTLERARECDSQDILVYANERNQASNLFLAHHKFQRVGSSGVMKAPATLTNANAAGAGRMLISFHTNTWATGAAACARTPAVPSASTSAIAGPAMIWNCSTGAGNPMRGPRSSVRAIFTWSCFRRRSRSA